MSVDWPNVTNYRVNTNGFEPIEAFEFPNQWKIIGMLMERLDIDVHRALYRYTLLPHIKVLIHWNLLNSINLFNNGHTHCDLK